MCHHPFGTNLGKHYFVVHHIHSVLVVYRLGYNLQGTCSSGDMPLQVHHIGGTLQGLFFIGSLLFCSGDILQEQCT